MLKASSFLLTTTIHANIFKAERNGKFFPRSYLGQPFLRYAFFVGSLLLRDLSSEQEDLQMEAADSAKVVALW